MKEKEKLFQTKYSELEEDLTHEEDARKLATAEIQKLQKITKSQMAKIN
jgi:hypothetical protein